MPKTGFRSITLEASLYDRYYSIYKLQKHKRSFSAYITSILDEQDKANKTKMRFKKLLVDDGRVIILDGDRTVIIRRGLCDTCKSTECVHVGFTLSLPGTST